MKKKKTITMEDWRKAGSFEKIAEPGDYVTQEVIDEFRDCIPPLSLTEDYLQVGEQAGFTLVDPKHAQPIYTTFKKTNNTWIYCGRCLENQTIDSIDIVYEGGFLNDY